MFLYANHLDGNIFTSEVELTNEELYCETCEDYDEFLGEANSREEAKKIISENNYEKEYIEEFLNSYFPIKNNIFYNINDLKVGDYIDNLDKLNKIYDTKILLKTPTNKEKKYQILFIGKIFNEESDKILKKHYNIFLFYQSKQENIHFSENISTNKNCVNSKIKANILDDKEMKDLGFNGKYYEGTKNEEDAPYWYLIKGIVFPKNLKYKNIDISFNINIPKNGDDIRIDVLDEDFCQPYDYQRILNRDNQQEIALIVFHQVEMWMDYFQRNNILSGHIYGEYI